MTLFPGSGLLKRIEAPERHLALGPEVGRVAEDVEQLLARLAIEARVVGQLLEDDDEARAAARPCGPDRSCSRRGRRGSCRNGPGTRTLRRSLQGRPASTAPRSGWRRGSAGRRGAPPASGRRHGRPVSTARYSDGLSARACRVPPFPKKWLLRSWRDAAKTRVVVNGVVADDGRRGRLAAADDAARAAIVGARCRDGVFAVVAALRGAAGCARGWRRRRRRWRRRRGRRWRMARSTAWASAGSSATASVAGAGACSRA